ncbi:hypothetical protein KIN24_02285 [Pseudomonas lundensis]|uniref:hypothetical protein n=1 Tax=Pseudomonas lundensis TaxID=86185 RepID=UPI001BD55065|nr:hypothetical protein [Pseudomonas lundensis]QVQ77951.1 hypothetical protein KIN24_02285 [Pseudomonas lundensis]
MAFAYQVGIGNMNMRGVNNLYFFIMRWQGHHHLFVDTLKAGDLDTLQQQFIFLGKQASGLAGLFNLEFGRIRCVLSMK